MEACDLNAAEARRLMGTKSLSVMELAQSCISRMQAVNHAQAKSLGFSDEGEFIGACSDAGFASPMDAIMMIPDPVWALAVT